MLANQCNIYTYEATHYWDVSNFDKALRYLPKAVHLDPKNKNFLTEMGRLGRAINRADIEFKALLGLV